MDGGQGMIGEVGCLTFNLGLPGLTVWGFRRMALAANNRERLAAAPGILSSTDADVIALQEVYRPADRRFLAQAMAEPIRSARSFRPRVRCSVTA